MRSFCIKALLCILLLTCSGCYAKKEKEPIRVVTTADIPPYVFKDEDKQLKGFEVDLIKHIGHLTERKVLFTQTYHLDMLDKVSNAQSDCAIAGICKVSDNKKIVFSTSYLNSCMTFLGTYSSGLAYDIGKSISFLPDSLYGERLLKKFYFVKSVITKPLPTNAVLVEELLEKGSDFLLIDKFHARELKKMYPEYMLIESHVEGPTKIAIAINANSALTNEINQALNKMYEDKTLEALKQKWNLPQESELSTKHQQ